MSIFTHQLMTFDSVHMFLSVQHLAQIYYGVNFFSSKMYLNARTQKHFMTILVNVNVNSGFGFGCSFASKQFEYDLYIFSMNTVQNTHSAHAFKLCTLRMAPSWIV